MWALVQVLPKLRDKILSNCPELKTVWRHCKQRSRLGDGVAAAFRHA